MAEEIITLEQYFIHELKPNLNTSLIAGAGGGRSIGPQKLQMSIDQGIPVDAYAFDTEPLKLIYMIDVSRSANRYLGIGAGS